MIDPLKPELRSLARLLKPKGIALIVGGGYGLVLKADYVVRSGQPTRFRDYPMPRSTGDVDCFLTAEVIRDADKTETIHSALAALGYTPVASAQYYQFVKRIDYGGQERAIKFDFLAAPVTDARSSLVKMDDRRIRPHGFNRLHAHVAPEALTVEDQCTVVHVGDAEEDLPVLIPHPFSYLLLKLHAMRDQLLNSDKEYGRYHAFDVYLTVALMTEREWGEAHALRARYAAETPVMEAGRIVQEHFRGLTSLGTLRVREYARDAGVDLPEGTLAELLDDLRSLILGTSKA